MLIYYIFILSYLWNFVNSLIYFQFSKNIFSMLKFKNLEQINNKRTLVYLYKDIVLCII